MGMFILGALTMAAVLIGGFYWIVKDIKPYRK